MLDCYHYYSREQALYIGRELEKLNYYWFEEPMDEHSTSSYVWLAEQLDIPVVGPETAEGKMYTRAEWILRGAGGHPARRCRRCGRDYTVDENCTSGRVVWHGDGGPWRRRRKSPSVRRNGYPRRILRKGTPSTRLSTYDEVEPWLHSKIDAMDDDGYVHSATGGRGLGLRHQFRLHRRERCRNVEINELSRGISLPIEGKVARMKLANQVAIITGGGRANWKIDCARLRAKRVQI